MTRLQIAAAVVAVLLLLAVLTLFMGPLYRLAHHSPRSTATLLGPGPTIIAHRGWSAVAPENTISAFQKAAQGGFSYELDVGLCATGEPVVLHDDALDRTTDGEGNLADAPLAEIVRLDAGSWFAPEFAGEPVPTLRQVLDALGGEVVIDIELKTTDDKPALAKAVVAEIERAGLVDRVFVSSFDPFLLEQIKLANPAIIRGQLVGSFEGTDLAFYEKIVLQNLLMNGRAQADMVIAEHSWLTPSWTRWLQGRGYTVMVWTANEGAEIQRVLDMGVDGVITDWPDRAAGLKG